MKPDYVIISILFFIDYVELHLKSKTEIEKQYKYNYNYNENECEPVKANEEIEIKRVGYSHMLDAMNANSGEVVERIHRITVKMPELKKDNTKTAKKSQNASEMLDKIVSASVIRAESFLG